MTSESEFKILKILFFVFSFIMFFFIGFVLTLFFMVDKVYAVQEVPSSCTISWKTNASTYDSANCYNSEPNIGGYTDFFNLLQSYNNTDGSQTWHFSLLIDLYVIDYGNQDGDFIQTPYMYLYFNNTLQTITNLTRLTDTQYVTCDDPNNCVRHRIYNFTFDWTGSLNGTLVFNFISGNDRADCGWLQDNPSTCTSSYPRVHWLSTTASYSDGGRFDDISEDLNNQTTIINGAINDSTSSINSNNNSNTQSVINNDNSNTQSIINNNNSNTQSVINNQRELLGDCHQSYNLFAYGQTATDSTSQYRPGTYQSLKITATDNVNIVKFNYRGGNYSLGYISMDGLDGTQTYYIKFRVIDKNVPYSPRIVKDTANSNNSRLVLRIDGGNGSTALGGSDYFVMGEIMVSVIDVPFEPYGETICTSKLDNLDSSIDSVNNSINDSNVYVDNSDFNNMNGNIATNSVISDLLLLPVTLFQHILNSVNGTCSSFSLGQLFGTNLTMPCINVQSYLGSALYSVIDVLISGFFVLSIRKKFVDIFNHITSLKDGGNELE